MNKLNVLKGLEKKFSSNYSFYKNPDKYNEDSCRLEFIDELLEAFGWDVHNEKSLPPQYREVIVEEFSSNEDRPDYTLTLRGVKKLFVEAKKPSVDIITSKKSCAQARRYGWNANHPISVLTNYEYLAIYDTSYPPDENDDCSNSRYALYHYTEYCDKYDEISRLISKNTVYNTDFDNIIPQKNKKVKTAIPVDEKFLEQINIWRLELGKELYTKQGKFTDIKYLNDAVQEFINQIVFLRICEDKNLPLYHKLKETITDEKLLKKELNELFKQADKRYNSGIFSSDYIIFDLSSNVIKSMIEQLYFPNSPYLFNIFAPSLLGKMYERFLTEKLVLSEDKEIILEYKEDCVDKAIVTTPIEIVKYMVESTLSEVCDSKSPNEILSMHFLDIACGSGIFLVEIFDYLQKYFIDWYFKKNQKEHLIEIGNGFYKLPLDEKKMILTSCIFGIDIDYHAVEVAKFSLLLKLIENESTPSVENFNPILPNIDSNVYFGNSLISDSNLMKIELSIIDRLAIKPFNWEDNFEEDFFDVIIGNPPYESTKDMHNVLPELEFAIYKDAYVSSYKQFDKYFLFIEQALNKVKSNGYVCFIVPNKFQKIVAGKELRKFISNGCFLTRLDDFRANQLFKEKTIYSSIVLFKKCKNLNFIYREPANKDSIWLGEDIKEMEYPCTYINGSPWNLTADSKLLNILKMLKEKSVPLSKYCDIFNGIQTSAETPKPIYWFSDDEIITQDEESVTISRNEKEYKLERKLLRPFFKPNNKSEKNLNSYSIITTNKKIIFPYDNKGHLITKDEMLSHYSGIYEYLLDNYDRLLPKQIDKKGIRDVPDATNDTWYQYGRTQSLTSFIDTPKLIVGVLSKAPLYYLDHQDWFIASGGTAGYLAISKKLESIYSLEYIQAWLSSPITEEILRIIASDFEGGFIARGSSLLKNAPFLELNFNNKYEKDLYSSVVKFSKEIYELNNILQSMHNRAEQEIVKNRKDKLICKIQELIEKIYYLKCTGKEDL